MANLDRTAIAQGLNEIYKRLPTRPFYLVDIAPEDYPSLRSLVSQALPILAPFSDTTIFIDPNGNRVQRAVHDTIHLYLNASTTAEGELRVAIEQSRLVSHYSAFLANVTFADLRGQTLYFCEHGVFPTDQVGFTLHWLQTKDISRVW